MNVIYNGVEITKNISVNRCIHEMFAEKRSDSLEIRFNDTKALWGSWSPQLGDVIEISVETTKTGIMFVSKVETESGFCTLKAYSASGGSKNRYTNNWEAVRFSQICESIAQKHGLGFQSYGITDVFYPYLLQNNSSDMQFLQRLCELEGFALTIFDSVLVVYSENDLENQIPSGNIDIASANEYQFSDKLSDIYDAVEVTSGNFSGIARATENNVNVFKTQNIPVTSNAEANRFSQGLLRLKNKNSLTGWISTRTQLKYSAASVVNLKCNQQKWSGAIFITRLRNDYVAKKSKLFFRKPLEY